MPISSRTTIPSPQGATSLFRARGAALLSVVLLIGLLLGSAIGPERAGADASPGISTVRSYGLVDATLRFGQNQYAVVVNDTITLDLVVQGFAYEWLDSDVTAGETVYYWLEAIDPSGAPALFGPVSATLQAPSAVALAGIQAAAEAGAGGGWPWALASVLALLAGLGLAVKRHQSARDASN